LRSNALGELIQLQRETTVADYQSKFVAHVTCCTGLSEKHQIDIFTNGLRSPLKTNVELEAPTTLEDAMALACTYEHCLNMGNDMAPRPPQRSSGWSGATAKPLALPALATAATPATPRLKRPTPDEMAAKRERGECYNCTENFSREHLKVCPMKGIYLLQMDDEPAAEIDTDADPLISLNAITGISSANTMQLDVWVDGDTLRALIDSGSTHSFISDAVASRLHLDPLPQPGLCVRVANGDRVATTDVCRAARIFIDSEEFVLDLFIIPLDGFDMVLSVHLLHTLGPILWDFTRARISCWRDGHYVVW
jgi:hypothetical protein